MGAQQPDARAIARRVAEVDAALGHELTALLERLTPLTADWAGGPAASFQNLRTRWLDDAARLHAAMSELSASVRGAS
jgi:uncharacterized protein YukE